MFVTGGTGFLGHSLLPRLIAGGYHVRALSRHPEQYAWLNALPVEIITGDIEDQQIVEKAVEGVDYVVHAAARFRFWGDQAAFEQTNVRGAANVLNAAVRAGVKKYVHVSTLVVIGTPLSNRTIDETHPTHPIDPYQRSKLHGEQVALDYFRDQGLPVVVLRPGAFYGPNGRYAFNRLFIEDALKGLLIKVDGGTHITFPVFIEDVAESIVLGLERGTPGEVYNICGETLTHNEANAIVSEEAGISKFRLNLPGWMLIMLARGWTCLSNYTKVEPYYPLNMRSYVFNNWRVSIDKACSQLGFRPLSFREGVRRTLDWYAAEGIFKKKSNRASR